MPIAYIVGFAAAAAVLFFIWHGSRTLMKKQDARRAAEPGRGIAGEAATAVEDVITEILESNDPRDQRKN